MWGVTATKAQNGDTQLWGWNRVFGADGSQQLLMSYQDDSNVELVYDQFFERPGEVDDHKEPRWMICWIRYLSKIIAGQEPLDSFDSVVEQWSAAGGQDMTDEVNEWYASSK